MNKLKTALLISLKNWDSLIEIPSLLFDGGLTVDIFCKKDAWVLKNKYYNTFIEGSEDDDIFTTELLTYIEKNNDLYDWIIPGDDVIIRLLNDRITDEALFYKIMPLTKIENRELLGSKAGFSELCTRYDIQTPKYLVYKEGATAAEIGQYVGYPLLMKLDKSEGGYGVFLCKTEDELAKNLTNVQDKENIVFQQFIQGYDINTEVLYKSGKLMVYSYSKTITVMGNFGVSTERIFYQHPDIEPELMKIGERMGLSGFGNVVFMYSETDNKHYLIEIDLRPNAWMYYGKFIGNDFSDGVRKIRNNDLTLVKPDARYNDKKIKISLYKKDVYRCLMEKDIKSLLLWATNGNGRWKYIPNYDKVLLKAINQFLLTTFKDMVAHKLGRKK